jgi:hypothetical protein
MAKSYPPKFELSVETAQALTRLDGLTPGDFMVLLSRTRLFHKTTTPYDHHFME